MGETQIKKTICMWCHTHCSVNVYVKDGQLMKVEGAEPIDSSKKVSIGFAKVMFGTPV